MEKRFFPQASFLFFILLLLIQVLWSGDLRQPGHHLPYRDALATEIAFWKLIFTRYSQDEYVIHDSEHLEIIYKVVAFDSSVSERVREKQLKKIKKEIKKLLLDFHHQRLQPQDLTPWELSIYHKFSRIKEHHKFFKAARRIRVQQGIRENFLAGVKRSFAYLPYLEKVFREEGLPHDLIYLPHVESSFNPEAVSHVGAVGMWQFMRSTARRFMKVNRIKDGRFDPLESTRAAARLLKRNYEVLHDWALAITAYNHGLAGMKRARRRYGNYLKIRDRYLRRSFGFASKNFYPEFLAVVEIMDSLSYYFPNIKGNQPLEFQEIRLPTPIKMTTFAHQFGLDLKELKRLNPGYRIRVWRGIYRIPAGYTLRLPPYVNAGEILAALEKRKTSPGLLAKKERKRPPEAEEENTVLNGKENSPGNLSLVLSKPMVHDENVILFAASRKVEESSTPSFIPYADLSWMERDNGQGHTLPKPWVDIPERVKSTAGREASTIALVEEVQLGDAVDDKMILSFRMEHPIPDDASLPQMSAISWSELSQGWGYGFSDKSVTRFDVPEMIPSITEEDYSENSLLAEVKPGIDRGGAIPIPITLSPASDSEERIELAELEIPIKTDDITQMGRSSSVSTTSPEFSSPSRGNAYFDEQQFYTSLVEEEEPDSRAVEFLFLEEPEETVHLSDKRLPEEYRKIWLSKPLAELTSERKGEVIDTQAFLYKIHLQEKNTPEWVYADLQQDERNEYLPKPGIESRAPVSTASLSESPTNSSKTEINVAGVESYSFLNDPSPSTSPGEGGKYRGNTHLAISEIVLLLKNKLQPQDDHIIVFPQETIGQISEWLKMSPYRLRKLNHLKRGNKIYTGQRLKVDFSRVSREVFLQKRLLFHLEILQHYLQHRHNVQIVQHRVKPGENLWYLAHRRYNFPVNLLLYFNDFDKLERLYPGDVINLPQIN